MIIIIIIIISLSSMFQVSDITITIEYQNRQFCRYRNYRQPAIMMVLVVNGTLITMVMIVIPALLSRSYTWALTGVQS